MNILVVDVAASEGGALTILNQFYNDFLLDKDNMYYICVSVAELQDAENIKIFRFPWVKKSWFHRLWFELLYVNRLIKSYNINRFFSLQNLFLRNYKCEKWVYMHQSIPFCDVKFKLFEDPLLWTYQNIIGKLICSSIKSADTVIVQTKWILDACVEKLSVDRAKFLLIPPNLPISIMKHYEVPHDGTATFFYPASALEYKNHKIIINALQLLSQEHLEKLEVVFTLNGNENKNIQNLHETAIKHQLPVKFIGSLNQSEVFEYYSKSALIFPSYIETFGLPLLEAKLHGGPILASDCAFSHEILDDYDNVKFFDPFCSNELRDHILDIITLKRN